MAGKKVADFTAAATGGTFTLSAQKGHPVVLYFYPKDDTPGCTTEGADFRDLHKQFTKLGAVIAGGSPIGFRASSISWRKSPVPLRMASIFHAPSSTIMSYSTVVF